MSMLKIYYFKGYSQNEYVARKGSQISPVQPKPQKLARSLELMCMIYMNKFTPAK